MKREGIKMHADKIVVSKGKMRRATTLHILLTQYCITTIDVIELPSFATSRLTLGM